MLADGSGPGSDSSGETQDPYIRNTNPQDLLLACCTVFFLQKLTFSPCRQYSGLCGHQPDSLGALLASPAGACWYQGDRERALQVLWPRQQRGVDSNTAFDESASLHVRFGSRLIVKTNSAGSC